MKVTLLIDNLASDNLKSEHGLSFLVDTEAGSVLFDTGQSSAWLENLGALHHNVDSIKAVALSHGHYDHTGGLEAIKHAVPRVPCYAHPACFGPKSALAESGIRYIGVPKHIRRENLIENRTPTEVLPHVLLSGEIPIREEFDPTPFILNVNPPIPDMFEDEQCLILKADNSISVLLGCSHRGVRSNLMAAVDVGGTDRIKLLAGGMHLISATPQKLEELAQFLKKTYVEKIVCCHCIGEIAYHYLREALGDRVEQGRAGMQWEI